MAENKIMLGNGTLPVAAPTLFESVEAQFVEAVSRTCPLRLITEKLGLARSNKQIIMGQVLTPQYNDSRGGVRHSQIYIARN